MRIELSSTNLRQHCSAQSRPTADIKNVEAALRRMRRRVGPDGRTSSGRLSSSTARSAMVVWISTIRELQTLCKTARGRRRTLRRISQLLCHRRTTALDEGGEPSAPSQAARVTRAATSWSSGMCSTLRRVVLVSIFSSRVARPGQCAASKTARLSGCKQADRLPPEGSASTELVADFARIRRGRPGGAPRGRGSPTMVAFAPRDSAFLTTIAINGGPPTRDVYRLI